LAGHEHRLTDACPRLAYRDLAGVAALLLLERASLGAVGLAVDLSEHTMSRQTFWLSFVLILLGTFMLVTLVVHFIG